MEEVPHFQNLKGEHKMENNAIMNNEVIETTEEVIENTGMSKGIKIAAGVGLSVIVGFVAVSYTHLDVYKRQQQINLSQMWRAVEILRHRKKDCTDEIRRQKQSRYSKVPMPKMQRYASGTSGLYIPIQAVRSGNHHRCFGRAYYLRNARL